MEGIMKQKTTVHIISIMSVIMLLCLTVSITVYAADERKPEFSTFE